MAERAADKADTPMSIESIIDFIEGGDIEGARAAVERQIELNGAISAEGLAHAWGAEVGRTPVSYTHLVLARHCCMFLGHVVLLFAI